MANMSQLRQTKKSKIPILQWGIKKLHRNHQNKFASTIFFFFLYKFFKFKHGIYNVEIFQKYHSESFRLIC